MNESFEIAAGTVAGRDHRSALKNSHDAYHFGVRPGILAGAVCDGCGSGGHSEVGAKIAARMIVEQVLRRYSRDPGAFAWPAVERELQKIRLSVLGQIQVLADSMGEGFTETISEYFLFTVLAVIMTRQWTFVAGAGDGIILANENVFPRASDDNKPDYISYGLVETENGPAAPPLRILLSRTTAHTDRILLGTDGAKDLVKAAEKNIPGKDEKVGRLDQFFDDRYFTNPFAIQRRLNLVNRTNCRVDYEKKAVLEEHGHLPDDTTVLVVRRKRG